MITNSLMWHESLLKSPSSIEKEREDSLEKSEF